MRTEVQLIRVPQLGCASSRSPELPQPEGWEVQCNRREPTLRITAMSVALMVYVLIRAPGNVMLLSLALRITGYCLHTGRSAFTASPIGLTTILYRQ
jgi:hypothetical protein